jgi:uncharacterized protein
MKNALKDIWRLVYPILIYFAIAFVVQYGAMLLIVNHAIKNGTLIMTGDMNEYQNKLAVLINQYSLQITAATNVVLMPIFALLLKSDNKRRRLQQGFAYKLPDKKSIALIGLLGMSAAVSVNAIVSISGLAYFSPKYQQVSQIIYSGGIFMEIVSAVIAAPILEELLFRGMIYRRLRDFCNAKLAIIISAVFFGVFHGNLVQFVYAFIIGLMLAYVYEKMKTIWAPIVFHVGANLLSVLITELIPQSFLNVPVIISAMAVCLALTVFLLNYVYKYNVGIQPAEDDEVVKG